MNRKRAGKDTPTTPYSIKTRTTDRVNTSTMGTPDINAPDSEEEEIIETLDPPNAKMIELMQKMIDKLEVNINTKLDRSVNEIKEDVSKIKEQIENYNGKFEEVQNRLGDCEDRVDKMGEVIEEVYDIKTEWEKTIKDMEKDACRIRKNNIIFHGVQGGSKDTNVALANFKRVCREYLKMSEDWIQNVDIKEIYHFPAKGGEGTWPLFVSLGKSKHREDLFRAP